MNIMMEERDNFLIESSTKEHEYKRFGIIIDEIDRGLSLGACLSYDKYTKECYLFINFLKWGISIGWLTFKRKEE